MADVTKIFMWDDITKITDTCPWCPAKRCVGEGEVYGKRQRELNVTNLSDKDKETLQSQGEGGWGFSPRLLSTTLLEEEPTDPWLPVSSYSGSHGKNSHATPSSQRCVGAWSSMCVFQLRTNNCVIEHVCMCFTIKVHLYPVTAHLTSSSHK